MIKKKVSVKQTEKIEDKWPISVFNVRLSWGKGIFKWKKNG